MAEMAEYWHRLYQEAVTDAERIAALYDQQAATIARLRAALTTIMQEAPPYASGVRSYAEAILAGEKVVPRAVCWQVSPPPTEEDYRIAEEIARKRGLAVDQQAATIAALRSAIGQLIDSIEAITMVHFDDLRVVDGDFPEHVITEARDAFAAAAQPERQATGGG